MKAMKTLGQEFHPYEAIRAVMLAEKLKTTDRALLSARIARELPQPSEQTRKRLAAKFIQRYLKATRRRLAPWNEQHFAHLVARTRHAPTQVELLFYELTKTDAIVGALARELFFPVGILQHPPAEYSLDEFAALNGNRLFGTATLLTRDFILRHAREQWNFADRASVDRALRVLLGAGLIARERMTELRDHPVAFQVASHEVAPATFVWALYDEYLPLAGNSGGLMVERAELESSFLARTLLLNAAQVEKGIEIARRHHLLGIEDKYVRLVFGNRSALVGALLAKAM